MKKTIFLTVLTMFPLFNLFPLEIRRAYIFKQVKVEETSLSDEHKLETDRGRASWYRHKGGMYAASTKFKRGAILRVINVANGKHVDVTVNDYGPVRKMHPDRIIDLDMEAFKEISSLEAGLIDVIAYPLKRSKN